MMLSTSDKFLGSLVGAYVGIHADYLKYGEPLTSKCSTMDIIAIDRSWQPHIEPLYSLSCSLEAKFSSLLPWMLLHHDNYIVRHAWMFQQLPSQSLIVESDLIRQIRGICLLSDCLEWFIQTSPMLQQSALSLTRHLRCRCRNYPPLVGADLAVLLSGIDSISSITLNNLESCLVTDVLVAVQLCLHYWENLALAFAARQMHLSVSMILGCFQGAWAGTTTIPMHWMMTVPSESMDALTSMGELVYRAWAGIADNADSCDVVPLDL